MLWNSWNSLCIHWSNESVKPQCTSESNCVTNRFGSRCFVLRLFGYVTQCNKFSLIMSCMQIGSDPETPGSNSIKIYNCDKCTYKSIRLDRVNRHVSTVHNKKKALCECGKLISPSVLSRHKKESCSLRLNRANFPKKTKANKHDEVKCGVETGTIQCKYQIHTSDDGLVTITHDKIMINGIQMTLVPVTQPECNAPQGTFSIIIQQTYTN